MTTKFTSNRPCDYCRRKRLCVWVTNGIRFQVCESRTCVRRRAVNSGRHPQGLRHRAP